MNYRRAVIVILAFAGILVNGCQPRQTGIQIDVYPDSVLSDISNHPVGINLDYFMDDDKYLKPGRYKADALKAMGVRYLRYPGGNKSDFYFFSKPPWEKSEPTLARTGKGAVGGRQKMLKNYSEFAVEWVRYANIKKGYGIKYWMIGNESWHEQNKNSSAEIYAHDVIDFSKAMKAVDSSIYIIPNGNDVDFSETVLKIAGNYSDMLCISNYPIYNYRAGYDTYRDTLHDLISPATNALTAMKNAGSPESMKIIVNALVA